MNSTIVKTKRLVSQSFGGYFLEASMNLKFFYNNTFSKLNSPAIKFVVFCHGRSGSTLLLNLLNSHPDIKCDGEILSRRLFSPTNHIKRRSLISKAKVYGFKLLSYQIRDVQQIENSQSFMEDLCNQGYKVIFLRRNNLLRLVLSVLYAEFRNEWHHKSSDGAVSHSKMKVDVNKMIKMLKESEVTYEYESELMKDIPNLLLSYEEDLEDKNSHNSTMQKVAKYLGIVNVAPSNPDLVKITPKSLDGFVENIEEVRDALKANSFEKYLEMELQKQ